MYYRMKLGGCLAIAILGSLVSAYAAADPPDILRNYRIIPRLSTLEVTGGFAGVHLSYDLFGKFGLVTGFIQDPVIDSPFPVLVPYAQFVDVDIKALLDHPAADAFPVPLDRFVNLETLWSVYDVPPVLNFRGKDSQGAPFKLQAQLHGRLIHLTGASDPPCCDFFNYKLDAYAHLAPFADFNFDGTVDSADYTAWRDHLGMISGATLEQGDADGDGDVDQADYTVWRQDLGTTIDMAALAAGGAALAAVPEPSSFSLMAGGVLLLIALSQWLSRRKS